ncbi:lysosomal-trafficking regulator-like isoform X2 [Mercenaria mercenaria]|nr:lysosomal-trafficking regulator-like isoform X2 [Mercenaria mercenaria]
MLSQSSRSSSDLATLRPLSLREVWEIYIKAVKSQDQSADNVEKQSYLLNVLVKMCAAEMKKGPLPNFSDMKSVCSQLCKEFMSDILHITSRSEDDDVTQLQKYLLEGRGWILLKVIHNKGIQTLTGYRDFANLLVSLLPWCLKFPLKPVDGQNIDISQHSNIPPVSVCFQNILKTCQTKRGQSRNQSVPVTRMSGLIPKEQTSKNSSSAGKRRYSKRKSYDSKDTSVDSEEESSETKDDRSKGKLRKKYRYCTVRSYGEGHTQPKADSESDDDDIENLIKGMNISNDNVISGFELSVLILELLQELTLTDLGETPSGKMISPVILPNMIQCLVSLDSDVGQLEEDDTNLSNARIVIKRHLVRVVLTCSGITAAQPNGMNNLISHRVVEQVLTSGIHTALFHSDKSSSDLLQNTRNEVCLMSDIVIGTLLCLTVVFENLPFNLSFIKTALHLIEEFDDHKGFQMLEQCILFNDCIKSSSSDSAIGHWLDDEPVKIIGTFLNTLKVVRVNYVHSMKCVKRKHVQCSYAQYFDHHHDILGVAATRDDQASPSQSRRTPAQSSVASFSSQSSTQVICLVSSCTQFLLDLLIKVTAKVTRLDLLKTIYSSGICCCMKLDNIMAAFVIGIQKFSPAVRMFGIDTLNCILLEHFSGGISYFKENSLSLSCSFCEKETLVTQDKNTCSYLVKEENPESKGMDSGIDSSDVNREAKFSALQKLSKWRAISQLKDLLYSNDEAVAVSIAKHLLVLAIKGNPYLKAELFFSVYSHALESVRKDSGTAGKKLSKSVQVHCLSALPYLLQANCVTKVFLSRKGVRKLCELLEDETLRAPVLRIFEALVVLDSHKLTGHSHSGEEECPCPYSGGKVIDTFISELSKRSFSNNEMYQDESATGCKGRIRRDSVVISKFSLPVLVDLWETCAKLCLHSHVFVAQFSETQSFVKTESLLLETLDVIMSPDLIGQLKSHGSFEAEDSGLEWEPSVELERGDQASFFQRLSLFESLIVVTGAGHRYQGVKQYVQLKAWQRVRERFTNTVRLPHTKLKVLLDSVMNAAMPQFVSLLEYSYSRNIALVHVRDDDIYDEDEVRQLLQSGSEEDNEILTEIGYDADSEETTMDDTDKDKRIRCSVLKSRNPYKIYFPTTFGLLFDLLVLLRRQEYNQSVISAVLYKLLQNVRMDVNLAKALCEQDVLSVILGDKGFWDSLLKTETEETVSENLVGLLEQLGQYRLESHDLQKILQLFQHSDIPMEKLLSVFLTILEKSPVLSHHSVKFPVLQCEQSQKVVEEEFLENGSFELPPVGISPLIKTVSDTVTNLFMSNFQKAEKTDSDTIKVRQEVWSTCALQTCLKDAVSWPPLQIGVTVAMWVCLQKEQSPRCLQRVPIYDIETGEMKSCKHDVNQSEDSTVAGCLHMLSIGTKEKLLEIWTDTYTGSLIFRLTSEVSDIGLVVKESRLSGVMSPDRWQHLVISYKEGYEGSTVMGNVKLVIDGWLSHNFVLDHPHSSIRSRHRSSQLQPHLCVGHTVTNLHTCQLGNWQLGHMMLFKGSPISKELCFHLYTLGPNNRSILKCDSSTVSTVYAPHLHKNTVLHSRIDYDTLVGIKRVDFTGPRNNLLLSYQPSKCKEMLEYPPVSKLIPNQSPSNLAYAPDALLTQQPKVVTPVFQGHLHSNSSTSLEMAIEESGGIAAILFLVAKVYERCPESMPTEEAEKIQSEVLKILMSVMHHSSQLQEEYLNIGGHALLCKVLTSSRSVPGQLTLKVIMDAATTESLYRFSPGSSDMMLKHKTDAVIRDVTIIEHLVLHWLNWERCDQSVTEMLFAGLACLVQEEHPHQNFNIKQYQAINIVNKIFKVYQERIQEGFPSLSVSVGTSVVSILQNMAGSPPDYLLILEICDFLLNVHPAANTYINHSKSLFYFNLSWGQPPSPLTKWKIGLGQGLASSTPVKMTYNIADRVIGKLKKNLSDSFIKEESESSYPEVDITNKQSLTLSEKPHRNRSNDTLEKTDKAAGNVKFHHERTQIETDEESDKKEVQETKSDSGDSDNDKTKDTKEMEAVESVGNELEPILTSSTNLHVSTGIPNNFESLYKTAISCDDSEPVKFLVGDDSVKDTDNTVRDVDAERTDISEDTSLGLNVNRVKYGDSGRMEIEKEVEQEFNDEETDDTEEASIPRDSLSLNFDEDNAELLKLEKGLTAVCVGLLRLLSSVIVTMPDGLVEKTFRKSIINTQTFIVLAQNSSAEVREAVIKLIAEYLQRCNHQNAEEFFKMDGFHLLSAQLFQYPTHSDQMEAAVSIVMQRPFKIDEGLRPDEVLEDLTRVQQSAIPLMLSLLSNTLGDLALCHNSIQFCCKLFETSDVVATVMTEQGVIEVLSNMLVKLIKTGSRDTDVEGMDESEILLGDLLEFYKVIAIREFSASGPQHYQHFEDILVLLQDLESAEIQTQGIDSKNVQMLRTFQQHIFVAIMDLVERTSEEVSQQSSLSFFSKQAPSRSQSTAYANNPGSFPSFPTHRNLSLQPQQFSLSGTFGRLPFRKKSPGGYFVQSDHPYNETPANSGSGDSDSSQDSWFTGSIHSTHTVNLPVNKQSYSRTKSMDISHGRLMRSNSLLQTVLSIGKRKKLVTVPISQNELIERLKKVITFAVDSAMFADRKPCEGRRVVLLLEMSPQSVSVERDYMRKLFTFTYKAFEATLPQEKSSYSKRNKNVIMWGAKDVLRVQLGRLLGFMLSSRQEFDQRAFALSYISGEQRGFEVLKMIVPTPEVGNDLGYFINDLMTQGRSWLSRQQNVDGSKMINHLRSAGFEVFSPSSQQTSAAQERLQERKRIIESRYESHKTLWIKRKEISLNRIFHQFDSQSARLSDSAMEVTQTVTHSQTLERNKFVEYLRQKKTDSIEVKKQWQEIVQNLTHERALWYDEKSYPQSWQLNPTEGPCRVRKRLQRGHLGILPKFLKKEFQHKLCTETVDPPLIYLFEDDHQISDSAALIYQLHKNKKIRHTSTCRAVSPVGESKGELLIGEDSVFFVADEAITDANYTQVLLGNRDQLSMTWPFEDVLEIHRRWYELMDTAIEIFLTNGKTCLLAFKSAKEREEIFRHLMNLELPNRRDTGNLLDIVDRWQNGQITNFEYLTYLNKKAGRTFNDLMQYPVMPFILRDYTSATIDLRDFSVYRDLLKPVSVQEPKNEQKFKMNYEILKSEYDKFGREGITGLRVAPYHYGSHYSNSGGVLHFLVRVPPFTKMFLGFQDQSFDIPDRTFHNIHTSWRLSSAESNTDVKELIPEFFFMHEFLVNSEGFEFGTRQNGEEVNNVILPPWCGGNPRMFVLIHRQALESEYVTEFICTWIDLVFGYKQRGEDAVKAINVFHPATYFGLDVSSVKNALDRKAIQTMVRTYGQTPRQLFRIAHPRQDLGLLESISNRQTQFPEYKLVSGLKWGTYLGSPDKPDPVVVWEEVYKSQVASLIALPAGLSGTSSVFGISASSCLLVQHSQDKQKATLTDTSSGVVWAAILTWGQQDGLVRIINGTNKPALNFIKYNQSDEVTCCVSVPDLRHLFFGGTSGVITIYNTKHNPAKESELQVFGHKRCLYGHKGAINSLVVCKPYSIMVSASQDATCIIWDLNRLSYVRSIKGHKSGVQVLAVSDTLGDIASASQYGMGSNLYLHTVNAEYVAMATCEDTINCLTYSTAAEGVSINVIAGGLSSGVVRLWSSWDLSPVRDLVHRSVPPSPVISLTFTKDSQKLYVSSSDGRIRLWDYNGQPRLRSNRFFKPYLY